MTKPVTASTYRILKGIYLTIILTFNKKDEISRYSYLVFALKRKDKKCFKKSG